MFEMQYQTGFSDIDSSWHIRLSSIMDMLQDISFSHISHMGFSPQRLADLNVACLLGGWRVRIEHPLDAKLPVRARVGVMDIGRCEAQRCYELWQAGERRVIATAPWFTLDIGNRTIMRIPDFLRDAFEKISGPDNGFPYMRQKPPEHSEYLGEYAVHRRDLDANGHMNNVRSIEAALEYLPEGSSVCELSVRYCKELIMGDVLSIYGASCDGEFHFEIQNQNKDLCVLICAKYI